MLARALAPETCSRARPLCIAKGMHRAAWLPLFFGIVLGACGTDARGIDSCRRIEESRCRRATACGVDLGFYRFVGAGETAAVEGCIRYYREACLHGLVAEDPGPTQVQACVDAINVGTCDVVKAPETTAACGWLVPPAPAPAPTADATVAATDAGTDSP